MIRRIVWTVCVVAVLATAIGAWFLDRFEPVAVPFRRGLSAEAQRDPYLALDRFLARMGRPLTRTADAQALDRLEPRSALLLDAQRRYQLTAERRTRLLAWVAEGGYLVVVPDADDDSDAIIQTLSLRWLPTPSEGDDAEEASDSGDGAKPRSDAADQTPASVTVPIPDAARPLSASMGGRGLAIGQVVPDWAASHAVFGAQFVHFTHGRGHITVVARLADVADNQRIGERDHADIIWALLQRYQPSGGITMVSRMHVPTLFEWLGAHAVAPLASLSVLIALALWRSGPRSGRLAVDLPPARRELREHLRAIGLFMWRTGELSTLATSARQAVLALTSARRFAARAAPDDAEQVAALATTAGHSRDDVTSWLEAPADTPRAFTASMRRLQQLESKP